MATQQTILETAPPPAVVYGAESGLSYEEFLRKYEGYHVEYVEGEVIGPMTVGLRYLRVTRFLMNVLQYFVETRGLGEILGEPFQIRLEREGGTRGRTPDLFFVMPENLDKLTDRFLDGAADLAVDVISPESLIRDTHEKFAEYETAGVSEYWIIDPSRRTANFYGLDGRGRYTLLPITADGRFESRVIRGLWIRPEWLWAEPLPSLDEVTLDWKDK